MSIAISDAAVRALYHAVLTSWNKRDAAGFAGHFLADSTVSRQLADSVMFLSAQVGRPN